MASRFLRSGALALLALGLVALIPGCGDEEVPAPTTPAPAPAPPAPAPPPAPEPPAAPGGLRISATGPDYIEWSWTPVSGATGYDVQYSANEVFTDEDEIIARTAEEISYRKTGLERGTSAYLRVRAAVGAGDERVTGAWSTHLVGMAEAAPPPPPAPAMPTGFELSDSGPDFIEWSWRPVSGATGYDVQYSANEAFTEEDEIIRRTAEEISYRKTGLDPETSAYLRVRAAAGTGEARVTSAWTTHVTGMTTAAAPTRLPAPMDVRVTDDQTETTMTWRWRAVEGAVGYHLQYSDSTPIAADTQLRYPNTTTYTARGLRAGTTHYMRVRAYAGTTGEPVPGDWSTTVEGTTERTPAPTVTQLSTPDVTVGARTGTTIRLTWSTEDDEVDDVDRYEVRQRVGTTGTWGDATCGTGGDEFVTAQECMATELEQGTTYQFGVRAHPDDDDDTRRFSNWSSNASAQTTGQQPEEDPSGGDDPLGITWTSDATSITWSWDAADDRRIQYQVALLADPRNTTATSTDPLPKCPALASAPATGEFTGSETALGAWFPKEPTFAKTLGATGTALTAGEVWGLCVVSTWDTDTGPQYGGVSSAWATTSPAEATVPAPQVPNGPKDSKSDTTAIDWYVVLDSGFEYEVGTVSVSVDDSPSELSCSSVSNATALKGTGNTRYRLRSPVDYTQYAACVRAKSGSSSSGWAMLTPYWTLPGTGPTPTYSTQGTLPTPDAPASNSDSWSTAEITGIVWSFSGGTSLPEDPGNYQIKVIGWTNTARTATTRPAPDCAAPDATNYASDSSPEAGTTPGTNDGSIRATGSGFENTAGLTLSGLAAVGATASTTSSTGLYGSVYLWACVRAALPESPTGRGNGDRTVFYGPWSAVGSKTLELGTRPRTQ